MNDQHERALDQILTALDVSESAVYIALRRAGRPHSLDEVAAAGGGDRTALGRTYKALIREVDFNLGPTDPHAFVGRFSDQLALDKSTETTAHNIVDMASEVGIRSGHSATGTAAGALYLAGRLTGEHMIQDEVADTTNTSLVALRDRYQEQATLLGIDRRAWSPPLASTFDAAPLSTEAVNDQLSGFIIVEMADDLLASQARCTACERTSQYEHLVRNHHTRWFDRDRGHLWKSLLAKQTTGVVIAVWEEYLLIRLVRKTTGRRCCLSSCGRYCAVLSVASRDSSPTHRPQCARQ